MDVRMFSIAAHTSDDMQRMHVALSKLPGVQDVMERNTQRDIIVMYDSEQLTIWQIVGACKPQLTIIGKQVVTPAYPSAS